MNKMPRQQLALLGALCLALAASAPDEELDHLIGDALGRLVEQVGVDRCLLARLSPDGNARSPDGNARTVTHWVAPIGTGTKWGTDAPRWTSPPHLDGGVSPRQLRDILE
jgi:hypothetical protein